MISGHADLNFSLQGVLINAAKEETNMSITRRQFLLSTAGSSVGAIIPDYYFRALHFFEQFEEPLLVPPPRPTRELFTFNNCDQFELCLGNPFEEPPKLTYREFYTRYQPGELESFEEMCGLGPAAPDDQMEDEWVWDYWFMHESPAAQAHSYLQSLDLGPNLAGPNSVGNLDLFEDSNMVSCWRGVRYENEITLSLLQQRLNDLGTGIRIVVSDFAV
jgi:hypothetical protein